MTPEQIGFVQKQLEDGKTPEQIEELLVANGYSVAQVQTLLQLAVERSSGVAVVGGVLPSYGMFSQNVRRRLSGRFSLFVIVTAYSLVTTTVLTILQTTSSADTLLLLVLSVISIPVSLSVSFMTLRNMVGDATHPLQEDISWVLRNFGSIIWLIFLSALIILAGFSLFIVPGIILAGYLGLSQSVRVIEGVRGINALIRSTELVQGHWWGSSLRISAVVIPPALIGGIAAGVVGIVFGKTSLITNAAIVVAQSVAGFIFVAATIELYYNLVSTKPVFDPNRPTGLRTLYRTLAWLSLIIFIGMIALVVFALGALFFTQSFR